MAKQKKKRDKSYKGSNAAVARPSVTRISAVHRNPAHQWWFDHKRVAKPVLIATGVIAGRSLKAHAWADVLPYSLAWGVLMGVLDAIMSVPVAGWQLYADWNVWIGYALVVLAPLLALYPRFNTSSNTSGV